MKSKCKLIPCWILGVAALIIVSILSILAWDYLPPIRDRFYKLTKYRSYPNNTATASSTPNEIVVDKKLGYRLPPAKHVLPAAKWVPQSYNNCGPATTSMILQYFGHNVSQTVTKAALRSNPTDSNVFTYEIQAYLKQYDLESKLFFNGSNERLKTLIANGFYIMVEDWLHPNEDIGHNTIIRGYDDSLGVFISDDSYIGVNITYRYEEFDQAMWRPFNREYLPIYQKDQEKLLKAIIGDDWEEKPMYERAIAQSLAEIKKNQNDLYAWFNLGSSYFGAGNLEQAKLAYEKARFIGWPRRMLWYQYQPIQVYNGLGEYQKALDLTAEGLKGNDTFAELHYEVAVAYRGLGNLERAKAEVNKALELYPNYAPAKTLQSQL